MATTDATNATWGVTTATGEISTVEGVITDLSITTEAIETPDVQNEEGTAVLRKIIEEHKTLEATIVTKNDVTLPETGDEITIDSEKYWINNITKTESNSQWTSVRISAEQYEHCDKLDKTDSMESMES
jgi:C4-type Zn-finger protein